MCLTYKNKKGEITIKIVMKPAGDQGAFELSVISTLKAPKDTPSASLFFVTPENNLTKQDPQQILDLAGNAGLREVYKGVA